MSGLILIGALVLLFIFTVGLQFYGLYKCFKKRWYIGLAGLVVPLFALIVGTAALFNKDILK